MRVINTLNYEQGLINIVNFKQSRTNSYNNRPYSNETAN